MPAEVGFWEYRTFKLPRRIGRFVPLVDRVIGTTKRPLIGSPQALRGAAPLKRRQPNHSGSAMLGSYQLKA